MKPVALFSVLLLTAPLTAGEPGLKQTILYVEKLQVRTGGFLSSTPTKAGSATSLRATSSGVRTLHYLGASVPYKEAAAEFVANRYDPTTGGFRDTPLGEPSVFLTAVGLMAVVELKMPTEKYAPGAVKYLTENVKSFEDIRIAAAGMEALGQRAPKTEAWVKQIRALQNPDGTFGKGAGMARATGGSVAALLRLGAKPADADRILKVMKAGQRQNGGFGKEDSGTASDLETTYRVMRCFVMLKARPDHVEGVRSFVAKCRNEDGGYGVVPGETSSMSGTYYAAVLLHWLK